MAKGKKQVRNDLRIAREILWKHWDPIGVNDCEDARGEYDGYAPGLVAMIEQGKDRRSIANHLASLQTVNMGLPGADHERDLGVADLLIENLGCAAEQSAAADARGRPGVPLRGEED